VSPQSRQLLRRLALLPVVAFAIVTLTFVVIRALPGNPAYQLAGSSASKASIERTEEQLGLDEPLPTQFVDYLDDTVHGNFGDSYYSSRPVIDEITRRLPATVELIIFALPLALLLGIGLALLATRGKPWARGLARGISTISMATPEFWLGLILIFVFFFELGLAPAPLGQLPPLTEPPDRVTGMYFFDALLAGQVGVAMEALSHLVLPVITLAFVVLGPITKVSMAALDEVAGSEWMTFARANGLRRSRLARYSVRGALPAIVTISGQQAAYLISGAVLVETVFSWNGFGQYAVESIISSDFNAVQAVVVISALITAVIYLVVDLVHTFLDPRTAER
jgi:peptide/nickel transport system permease protein